MAILGLNETLVATRIITSTENIPAPITAAAAPIYAGAVIQINQYALDAPDSVKNLALERLFGYLWEVEHVAGRTATNPLIQSGAASILSDWKVRRLGRIDTATATSTEGLTEAQVRQIVQQQIETFINRMVNPVALVGNIDRWEKSKLDDEILYPTEVRDEAKVGNTDKWPKDKLPDDVEYSDA